jgi:hypothetical protein
LTITRKAGALYLLRPPEDVSLDEMKVVEWIFLLTSPFLVVAVLGERPSDTSCRDPDPDSLVANAGQTLTQTLLERSVSYTNHKVVEIFARDSGVSGDVLQEPHSSVSALPQALFNMNASDGLQMWESNGTHIRALVDPSLYLTLTNMTSLHVQLLHPNIQEAIDRETIDIIHARTLKFNANNLVVPYECIGHR